MQTPQPDSLSHQTVHAPKHQPKAPWHRPTITFVPLTSTAFNQGSPIDGNTGSGTVDALDDSTLK